MNIPNISNSFYSNSFQNLTSFQIKNIFNYENGIWSLIVLTRVIESVYIFVFKPIMSMPKHHNFTCQHFPIWNIPIGYVNFNVRILPWLVANGFSHIITIISIIPSLTFKTDATIDIVISARLAQSLAVSLFHFLRFFHLILKILKETCFINRKAA